MSFRRRDYPEVLDNVLTEVLGGVAAEAHPFPPNGAGTLPFEHALEKPKAKSVISVYGQRNGQSERFRAGIDYELRGDGQTLRWLGDARTPDAGTLVHVNYLREDTPATLTDLQVGSVLRTLSESVSLEMARLYAQLGAVYDAAFIDTATGGALDKVVAVLGVERIRGQRATAELQFSRAEGTPGVVTLPAGTRVVDARARVEYATTTTVTLLPNQTTVRVAAVDLEPDNSPVDAGVLTVLPIPIAGIGRVTNPAPGARATADESDGELRARAKAFLHGSERATLGALRQVLARQQLAADIEEVAPGLVRITPHAADMTPELRTQLLAELDDVRPAGVVVELAGAIVPLAVALALRVQTQLRLPPTEVRAIHEAIRNTLATEFAALPVRSDASLNRLVGKVLGIAGVEDCDFLSARVRNSSGAEDRLDRATGVIALASTPTVLGETTIVDPNLPTELELVVRFPTAGAVPDALALETALTRAIADWNTRLGTAFDAADSNELARRTLSLRKIIALLPLPGRTAATLAQLDTGAITLPTLADIAPLQVTLFVHDSSGVSRILDADAASYLPATFEQLALIGLQVVPLP